jgi:hypothetical protein
VPLAPAAPAVIDHREPAAVVRNLNAWQEMGAKKDWRSDSSTTTSQRMNFLTLLARCCCTVLLLGTVLLLAVGEDVLGTEGDQALACRLHQEELRVQDEAECRAWPIGRCG